MLSDLHGRKTAREGYETPLFRRLGSARLAHKGLEEDGESVHRVLHCIR